MKRMNAIAAVGAAILAISVYLAGSGFLAQTLPEMAAVTGASPSAASSPTSSSSQAAELETVLAEFGVFEPTSSEIAAATGASSSGAMSSAVGGAPASRTAAFDTVALKVDGMWCPSCSYFVHQALTRTAGVLDAKVSGRRGTALVKFDPSKTTVAALIAATTNYGYPSQVIQ